MMNSKTQRMVTSSGQLISNSDQNIIKTVLGDKFNLLASVPARLYFAEKGSKKWKRIQEASVLTLNQSKNNDALYFNFINLNQKSTEWTQELYLDFKYFKDKEYFHSFEGEKGMFGILFVSGNEAKQFYQVLMDKLESYVSSDNSDSKSKPRSKSIFEAFGFGRRSSKSVEKEDNAIVDREDEAPKKTKKKEKQKDSDLTHDDVSEPRDFTHLSHIGFNPIKGTFDIQNIPEEWKTMFSKAGITQDQLENRSTAKFIAGFVQDSEPQMKQMMSKRKPPAPVPLKKKSAPPPPPTPTKAKKAAIPVPISNPVKTSSVAAPPPPPPKKAPTKSTGSNNIPAPPPPQPPTQVQSQIPNPPTAHSALLESIRGAGIGVLKPTNTLNESKSSSTSAPVSGDPHSALMASIKGGASLKPAQRLDRSPSSPTSSVASTDPTDMMAAMLAKALAARNKKLAADSSDEEEDSDDSRW